PSRGVRSTPQSGKAASAHDGSAEISSDTLATRHAARERLLAINISTSEPGRACPAGRGLVAVGRRRDRRANGPACDIRRIAGTDRLLLRKSGRNPSRTDRLRPRFRTQWVPLDTAGVPAL